MRKIYVGGNHILCVDQTGSIWAFGDNRYGNLGLGDTTARTTPTQLSSISHPKSVACGYSHSMILDSSGVLWSFGSNAYGQLGLGDTVNRLQPTQVTSMKNVLHSNTVSVKSARTKIAGTSQTSDHT